LDLFQPHLLPGKSARAAAAVAFAHTGGFHYTSRHITDLQKSATAGVAL
jgi:hypothetical protein